LEAYDLYLQAKQLISRVSAISLPLAELEDLSKAIKLLAEAIQKDPNFALGYCLIAKAHDILYSDLLDHTPERRSLGDAAVNEALRLRRNSDRIRDHLIELEPDQPLFSLNKADAAFCEKGDLKSVRAVYDALSTQKGCSIGLLTKASANFAKKSHIDVLCASGRSSCL